MADQPARRARSTACAAKRKKTMTETKNAMSRKSRTPRWTFSKCVMKLNEATRSTKPWLTARLSRLSTGGHPQRMRKRQMTTARMKLTTWLRVRAEVNDVTAR